MISKLTAWAPTREAAIERMERALEEYEIAGVNTTIPFCQFVMRHNAFREGTFDTGFVGQHFAPEALAPMESEAAAAALSALLSRNIRAATDQAPADGTASRWIHRRW